MGQTFDAIIIGAGIMGCSTAFQLAKQGVRVAVFEKGYYGNGSTGHSSAVIRQHYSNELTARMALHSLRVFQNFDDAVGGDCGFVETGFLALASAKDMDGLAANVTMQKRIGINTDMISASDLRDLMPTLAASDLVSAAYEPEGGYADPNLTVTAFAQAAKRHGATFFLNTEVTNVRFSGGKVAGISTRTGEVDAPVVLNSAGPWGARVATMAGVDVPINACRVQVTFFRRPSVYAAPHPVVADFVHATYFRAETGNLTLAGLIDPEEANAVVNPDNFNGKLDTEFVLELGEKLVARLPLIEQSKNTGGYAALYAITPDWHPLVDELLPDSGFFISAGFSGHGFKLGPAAGVMIADMLTGASAPLFDPTLFRATRYAENQPVVGQYEYSIAG